MTTQEFIAKTYNTTATKERRCSSVFTDYNGVVFSYGRHYPLAFNIGGLDFINTKGYSSSTSKHIAWTKGALEYQYIGVELDDATAQIINRGYYTETQKLSAILKLLNQQSDELELKMLSKNRKDTAVYADLQRQFDTINNNIITITTL